MTRSRLLNKFHKNKRLRKVNGFVIETGINASDLSRETKKNISNNLKVKHQWNALRWQIVKKLIYLMNAIKKNVIYFFRIYCKGITWRDFKWISSATFTNVFKTEEVKQAFERVLKSKKKTTYRSSHQKVSCQKCAFKYFAKFARKHLCWSLFLIKFGSLQPATLSKKKKRFW